MNNFNTGDKVYTIGDIDRLERENAELKAQVELLREMAYQKDAAMLMKYDLDGAACRRIYALLNDLIPAQCLAEVKAQAVEAFATMLRNEAKLFEVQAECRSKGSSWYNWQTHYAGNAEKFAKTIRQSAKAGA